MPKVKTRERYCIIGSDFSAQEPRIMTHLSGDETFRKIFAEGRDPYASISQLVLHKDYWDCMEHHEDGTPNPDGKARRSVAKGLMLGILYGMGAKLMSQIIGVTVEECKGILNEFFKEFPKVKEFCSNNERKAKEQGYVEDYLGRRRHLPDAQLQEIVVKATQKVPTEADLFFECSQEDTFLEIPDEALSAEWQRRYDAYLKEQRFGAKQRFKEDAKNAGITVQDNGAFISKTMTQCSNARIQGCLSGESRIQTREQGIVPISAVANSYATVWDGKSWSNALVLATGKKRKCIVKFSNGQEVVCSPNHLFAKVPIQTSVPKKIVFTECTKLKAGDRIRISELVAHSDCKYTSARKSTRAPNANNYYLDMIQDSYQRGVFLGRLASDGSINNRSSGGSKSIRFIVAEHEKDVVDKLIRDLPFKYTISSALREGRSQRLYCINIYSKTLVEEIVGLGIKTHIDDRIFKDTEMLRGFLSGMFGGDVTARHGQVSLTFGKQHNFIPYMRDVQKALLFFGVESYIRTYAACYRVSIKKQACKKFAERIGFISDEKVALSKEITTVRDGHIFRDVLLVKEVAITEDYIDMYDVCNTDRGYFVVDGVVTHNSAASLTKRAMLAIDNDPIMQDFKFQLLIPVHDELLGECPIAYADVVEQRLTQLMVGAAKPECSVAMKCDAYVVKHWYEDEAFNQIHKEYAEMTSGKDAMDAEEAIHKLMKNYPELSEKTLREMSSGQFDVLEEDI